MDDEREVKEWVDRLLLEQGSYQPVELLLAGGWLDYADYDAWRGGGGEPLAALLFGDPARLGERLERAAAYARALKLEAEAPELRGWGGGAPLRHADDPAFDRLLRTRYRPAAGRAQLDLFFDGGSTTLVNGIAHALAGRDRGEAERQLAQLRRSDPGHARLGELERLVEAAAEAERPVADPAAELERLERRIAPLADGLLGGNARHFLAPLWRRLLAAVAGLPFDPLRPSLHTSHLAERLGEWKGVVAAVEAEPAWHENPMLLRRHARACDRLHRPGAALASWFRLCWLDPAAAAAVGEEGTAEWRELWRRFGELDPELPEEAFPAWLLVERPGLGRHLDPATRAAAPEPVRLLLRLQDTPPGDPTHLEARQALKGHDPRLFDYYLGRYRG